MSTTTRIGFLLVLALCAMLPACGRDAVEQPVVAAATDPHPTLNDPDVRVIIMMIDGPRYSEAFVPPRHAHFMWNNLRPLGTVCTNFRNLGDTFAVSGHGSVLTGVWQHLDQDSPHLVMCSLNDVDKIAHLRNWNNYVKAIEVADSLIALTWNHVQADPDYAGKTYLFVTADHGRHDDAHGDVNEHGDSCDGCQHLIFLALGPNIKANQQIDTAYNQRDLCRTVGQILGVSTPQSQGAVMSDLFVPLPTGVLSTSSP